MTLRNTVRSCGQLFNAPGNGVADRRRLPFTLRKHTDRGGGTRYSSTPASIPGKSTSVKPNRLKSRMRIG